MNSENKAAIDKIMKEANNPLEAFLGVLFYYMVHIIFRAVEVVMDSVNENAQVAH